MSDSIHMIGKPPQKPCPICMQGHSPLTLCKHDFLVQIISMERRSIISLAKANREAVAIAGEFQNLIRDMEPFTQALKGQADMLADVISHALECGHFTPEGSTEKWAKDSLEAYNKFIGPIPGPKAVVENAQTSN